MSEPSIPVAVVPGKFQPTEKHMELPLVFSFKHLHCKHKKFVLPDPESSYSAKLVQKLVKYSGFTAGDLLEKEFEPRNSHAIDFDDERITEQSFGLEPQLEEQFSLGVPWQFSVEDGGGKGRFHGVILGNHVYVIWLDCHHRLYSPREFGDA